MPTVRRGLNATLSYPYGKTTHAYRVRCTTIVYGLELVFDESQGRTMRALYPMKQIPTQFTISAALVGYKEHTSFSDWLSDYALYALNPPAGASFPVMSVSVPSRGFSRSGVPVSGMEWGDHVGSMVWNRAITFETTGEPWDSKKPKYSRYEDPEVSSLAYLENRYFYPSGVQLSGNEAPPDGTYVAIVKPKGADWQGSEGQQTLKDAKEAYDYSPIVPPTEATPVDEF
jgi:hypothetical protein